MLETTRQNFDGERIKSNMTAFRNAVGGLAECYRFRDPNPILSDGIVLVGLIVASDDTEKIIDKKAKELDAHSPDGWQRKNPQHMTFQSRFESINGYRFT